MSGEQFSVYCDGDFLVVPIEQAEFPDRCVITNEPGASDHRFVTDLFPNMIEQPEQKSSLGKNAAKLVGGVAAGRDGARLVEGAFQLAKRKRLTLHVRLSKDQKAKSKTIKLIAFALMVGSPILGILVPFVYGSFTNDVPETLIFLPIAIGFALVFVGVVVFILAPPWLQVVKSDGVCVWIKGAGKDYLASLPVSPITMDQGTKKFHHRDD